jgi:hypothetical protein
MALLGLTWIVFGIEVIHANQIKARFAPATEVSDSLAQAGYIGDRMSPYNLAIMLFDVASFVFLNIAVNSTLRVRWKIGAWVCLLLSMFSLCVHGILCLFSFPFRV